MASRENQGLQIALILFVMITVALAVTTYVYWAKSEQKDTEAEKALAGQQQAANERDAAMFAVELLKHMIGKSKLTDPELEVIRQDLKNKNVPVKDEIAEIEKDFQTDIAVFDSSYTGERNYKTLPQYLVTTIRKQNQDLVEALDRERKLKLDNQAIVQRETGKTQQAEKGLATAVSDKDKVMSNMSALDKRLTGQNQTLATEVSKKNQEMKKQSDELNRTIKSLEQGMAQRDATIDDQKKKIAGSRQETFETPDGRIQYVNQRSGLVWIDLGSADGLPRSTTFSIYDKEESNVAKSQTKGSVEVTRIIDSHLSEARILDDDLSNPILQGDLVYSPTWQPGRPVRFALAGFIDIDGDGRSDQSLVRNLITMNGGIIDAEVGEDGRPQGTMTVDTRYLVLGQRPTEKNAPEVTAAYTTMIGRAQEVGVEQISVDKLLGMMGYVGKVGTVGMGDRATSSGVTPPSTGSTFRERTPPPRGKSGAY
jgi:hypothetical protein